MKPVASFFSILLIFSSLVLAQTEIWRIDGNYGLAIRGDGGNIYLAESDRLNPEGPNSLMKIGSDGSLIWEEEISHSVRNIFYCTSGIYVLQNVETDNDSCVFFNFEGEQLWGQDLLGEIVGNGAIDQTGNLYAIIQGAQYSLLKLSSDGNRQYQVPLPTISFMGEAIEEIVYDGPVLDNAGEAYVIVQVKTSVEKENESYSRNEYGYIYVYQFVGTSWKLVTGKPALKKDKVVTYKESERGTSNYLLEIWPYLMKLTISGNKILLSGTHQYVFTKETERGGKEDYLSQWRILVVDITAKAKMFKYKGRGIYKCREEGFSTKSDYAFNLLNDFDKGASDFVYIIGTIAKGAAKCDEGEVTQSVVLMKNNISTRKAVWVITLPEISEIPEVLWVTNSQKIMIPINGQTIKIYDANGNPSSTILSFVDPIIKDYIPKDLNKIDGTIYLNMEGYFAKYTIPSMQFVPGFVDQYQEEPETFNLYQNYPNPFNPATVISFHLPEPSLVTLRVYNVLGQEVAVLLNQELLDAGTEEIEFDAKTLSSGLYFYKLTTQTYDENKENVVSRREDMRKMLLVK